ncbi:MAG: hypothetical protein WD716_04365 [Fimbriimonadaceae bacterium]
MSKAGKLKRKAVIVVFGVLTLAAIGYLLRPVVGHTVSEDALIGNDLFRIADALATSEHFESGVIEAFDTSEPQFGNPGLYGKMDPKIRNSILNRPWHYAVGRVAGE